MKHLYFIFLFLLSLNMGFAQNGTSPMAGGRGVAMGGASLTFTDINSAFSNQAGLAFLEDMSFSLGADMRFFSTDISSYSLAYAYPMEKAGTFGLAVNYYGFSGYNEQRIGLAYARKLSKKLSIGAQLDYLGFSIPEYGRKSIFTFELGMQAQLIENLSVAIHVFNPVRQEIVPNENVPTVFRIGTAYTPNKKLVIAGELEKDIEMKMQFKAGVEYFIIDILALRAGVSTNPTQNSFGLGLKLDNGLNIDMATSYHYMLGFTPAISLSYGIKKKKS
jgi:long-subunit fatty acid transport protein